MQVIDNILAPLELYPVLLLQEIFLVQKQSIINIPIHHTGKLEQSVAMHPIIIPMIVSKRKIVYSHALRNAAPPIITVLALSVSGSLGGAIITEAVFDWPGMGRLYFEAITVLDLPVIIGATYVLTVFFLVSVFIADLLYGYFDPRVRRS